MSATLSDKLDAALLELRRVADEYGATIGCLTREKEALQAELDEEKQAYDTLTGLLNKRFPQRADGSMPDWKVEDVFDENARLREALASVVEQRLSVHTERYILDRMQEIAEKALEEQP